ncbi:glutamyl endopeptidase precursor [Bacillus atrophaeus UCMB-5137]|nr:glutamyl endopeptidase precursor [Bacillus atrophaeus UCMB-5137]
MRWTLTEGKAVHLYLAKQFTRPMLSCGYANGVYGGSS